MPSVDGLYVVVVRYELPDGSLKGYGLIAPDGTTKKFTEGKLMQYAREGKVKNAKTVTRANGTVFLQGVGQPLESLPKKVVQQ
jgi:homoaconitase/3-isopropylmalate dehydratase large subunit